MPPLRARTVVRHHPSNSDTELPRFVRHWLRATNPKRRELTLFERQRQSVGDDDGTIRALARGALVMLALFDEDPQEAEAFVRLMERQLANPPVPSPEVQAAFEDRAQRLWAMRGSLDPKVIRGR